MNRRSLWAALLVAGVAHASGRAEPEDTGTDDSGGDTADSAADAVQLDRRGRADREERPEVKDADRAAEASVSPQGSPALAVPVDTTTVDTTAVDTTPTVAAALPTSSRDTPCKAALAAGHTTTGPVTVSVGGTAATVYCDMETDHGGWTLLGRFQENVTTTPQGMVHPDGSVHVMPAPMSLPTTRTTTAGLAALSDLPYAASPIRESRVRTETVGPSDRIVRDIVLVGEAAAQNLFRPVDESLPNPSPGTPPKMRTLEGSTVPHLDSLRDEMPFLACNAAFFLAFEQDQTAAPCDQWVEVWVR